MTTTTSAMRPSARLLVALVATLSILAAQLAVFAPGPASADGHLVQPDDTVEHSGGSDGPNQPSFWVGYGSDRGETWTCQKVDSGSENNYTLTTQPAEGMVWSAVIVKQANTNYVFLNPSVGDTFDTGGAYSHLILCQRPAPEPVPDASVSLAEQCDPTGVAYTVSNDGDGTVYWQLTDNSDSSVLDSGSIDEGATGVNDVQPYDHGDTYDLTIAVYSDAGLTNQLDTTTLTGTIDCPPTVDPVPDASVSLAEQCDPTGVAYTVSNDGDGTVYWQLTDNSDSSVLDSGSIDEGATGVNDVQPYDHGDTYDLTIAVYSDAGLTNQLDTTTLTGTIDCPPPFEAEPSIELVKSAVAIDGDEVVAGELVDFNGGKVYLITPEIEGDVHTITYEFDITNTGNVTLFNVTLTDPMLGGEITIEDTTLAPGASTTGTATYDLTEDDIAAGTVPNTATVTGVDEEGTEVSDTDDETFDIVQVFDETLEPSISVVKDAVDGVSDDGEGNLLVTITGQDGTADVTYRYVVTNTGDDDLTDLTLIDDKIGDLTDQLVAAVTAEYGGPVLPVDGQVTITAIHEVSADDFDGITLTNLVDVTGLGVDSGATVTDDDDETVVLIQVLDTTEEAEEEDTPATASRQLPRTGLDTAGLTGLGLLIAAIGAGALLFTPRRTEDA